MSQGDILKEIMARRDYQAQVVHIEALPARKAQFHEPQEAIDWRVEEALRRAGITRLYSHQALAIDALRRGESVVIVTATASGKTLCYNIPVVEALAQDSLATALYLYPTKALAQDQLRALEAFRSENVEFVAGTYDGDTPQGRRSTLRTRGRAILTNPDMLHQAILPHHARWSRLFTHLRYVVLDEVHAYRGVFGSHLANVMRRLSRICEHYGATPQFVCCSATIANPREHAERIVGRSMTLIDSDGAPRGPKQFALWNPPPVKAEHDASEAPRAGGTRRGMLGEAVGLMSGLIRQDVQTIAFVRTRLAAELLLRRVRDELADSRLANSIQAYRGGYLPEERREIERGLSAREILGVATTNALELGIDIGGLDACLIVGYPGTVASLWQQAGRAGRGSAASLAILIGGNAPIDQYLMAHPEYIFAQNPENAIIDPDNPHITVGHLRCACHELPLACSGAEAFGEYADAILELLAEEGSVRELRGRWHFSSTDYPASKVSLRSIPGPIYTIQDSGEGGRVIGAQDESSALAQLHTHAVYMHAGETYIVTHLDLDDKIAHVERREVEYYTQSVQVSQIRIDQIESETDLRGSAVGFGDVIVTTTIPMFRKIGSDAHDSLGYEQLELPAQMLETVAMWLAPSPEHIRTLRAGGLTSGDALIGLANVLVEVAPLFAMCDTSDIGATVDSGNLGVEALFLFDRYPGGMGFAERCMGQLDALLKSVGEVIERCSCDDGCPSCVGSAVPAFAQTDLDSSVRGRIPSKSGARRLLELVCEAT